MARSNKYASLNFNDIYEKKLKNNSNSQPTSNKPTSSSFAKPSLSNSRKNGHMLVLSRPTPKPISVPQKPSSQYQDQARSDPEPDPISLRPQGRIGSGPVVSPSPVSPVLSPVKSDRFVPPHLRPGFVGKEEKPEPESVKTGPGFAGHSQNPVQSPGRYGEVRRPQSGGGFDRLRRGGEPASLNRPSSSGNRPSSSGY